MKKKLLRNKSIEIFCIYVSIKKNPPQVKKKEKRLKRIDQSLFRSITINGKI